MPSSDYNIISYVMNKYMQTSPETVLDVGCGNGKWGFLFREYGDIFKGRLEPKDWKVLIHGVEIFEKYINETHRRNYDHIIIGDIVKHAQSLPTYDFIYAGDVIEHLPKQTALEVLDSLKNKAGRMVVSIPLGMDWPQGEEFGNPAEAHLSVWSERDFSDWSQGALFGNNKGKKIGVFNT